MFKWPRTPSPRAHAHEVADYAELVCWQESIMSRSALSKQLGRIDEFDYSDGVPEEDATDRIVDEAYREIELRQKACRDGYPFVVSEQGYTLDGVLGSKNDRHMIYRYLLLATRLDMAANRVHADIDGTSLFEELASEVARNYLGDRAESLVFGSMSEITSFSGRVNYLCRRIQEGDGFVNRDEAPEVAKDGRLDVVAWKDFTDEQPGKLIAFGQCKTGTSYGNALTQLQPDSFCRKWLRSFPILTPLRMFFVAEARSRLRWYSAASDAGLLFDRCRIIDFCDDISSDLLERVSTWTATAAKQAELAG